VSTNFYIRSKSTNPFNGEEGQHIGKRSAGWTFGFQGRVNKSIAEWKNVIDNMPVEQVIVDEYDNVYTPEEFWAAVEATRTYNGKPAKSQVAGVRNWNDHGFSFSAYEFC
jgi:hypothetical protein